MALVSPENSEFPIYGDKANNYVLTPTGEVAEEDKKATAIETIQQTVFDSPELVKDATGILEGFNQILSMDKDREVKPFSKEEIEIAKLKTINARLEKENDEKIEVFRNLQKEKETHAGDIEKLNSEKEKLYAEIERLNEENENLRSDNTKKQVQIEKLQSMLSKTLDFATKVRESFAGRFFFKKQIEQLDIDKKALPEGEDEELER